MSFGYLVPLMFFQRKLNTLAFIVLLCSVIFVQAEEPQHLDVVVGKAYNFDLQSFAWLKKKAENTEDPLTLFLAASSCYWQYQSDRINSEKREITISFLDRAIKYSKIAYKKKKKDPHLMFFMGVSYCNRARFYVEEKQWFRSYLDSREGMGILNDLLKDHPDYYDANFALGVAECFLSDAPLILKPLARLLGFRGSSEKGIQKLELCVNSGEWTSVEAEYYLAYYYYNVISDGSEAISRFSTLLERYPKNAMFGYFLGRSYQINHEPLKALKAYQNIRDVCYRVEATDIGNWTSYRIGNILHGEQRYDEALVEYRILSALLSEDTLEQEYHYRLPLKIAKSFLGNGDHQRARNYLEVIRSEWDGETYKRAKKLLKELDD